MRDERVAPVLAFLFGGLVAVASALEGSTLPVYGGTCFAAAAALAFVAVWVDGVDAPTRTTRVALGALALTLLWQALPTPMVLHRLLAPGQGRLLDFAAPEWEGDLPAFLDALARFDVLAAVGAAGPWDVDVLAGSIATAWRPGTIAPEAWPWAVAQLGGAGLVYLAGVTVGRSERGARVFALSMLAVAVVEAVIGIAWRDGTSTGIGEKTAYLGSATGTFVNRGHFGALLALGLGAAWGLGAALFPLVPEEVRRHRARQRRSSQPPSVLEVSGDKIPRLSVLGFAAATLGIGLVASQSRGPVMAFALAGTLVGVYAWRRRDETFHLGIGVGLPVVSAVLAAVGFGLRGAFGRFSSLLGGSDVSLTSRLQVWREGLHAFLDAPVFGAGAGAWRLAWGVHEEGVHLYDFDFAHNEGVERFVELGAVGGGALLLGLVAWLWAVRGGLDVAEHTPRTAIGVGATVGALAVAIQSLGDFPLHTPAVLLATALTGGVAVGALTERVRPASRSWAGALALVTVGLSAVAAWRDAGFEGTRAERLGERPAIFFTEWPLDTPEGRDAFHVAASALARVSPLDPWAQVALALAEGRLAQAADAGDGSAGAPEVRGFAAERAIARALRLRPRNPRVQLACARVLVGLASTGAPDARRERAIVLLATAVHDDPWRAREAFELTRVLPLEALARIADAAPDAPTPRARVLYEYGRALDARSAGEAAVAAYDASLTADPTYGPALFARGVIARGRGEDAQARDFLTRFIKARERPGGMEGWAWFYLGDVDAAEVRFRRAVAEAPANVWAWEGLARIAEQRGDAEAERQVWRKVLEAQPGHPRARERLAVLGG